MKKITVISLLLFLLFPQLAVAASDKLPWYVSLLIVTGISTLTSSILVWRSNKLKTFTEKAMGFGAWFWFIIFIQVLLYGIYVGLIK